MLDSCNTIVHRKKYILSFYSLLFFFFAYNKLKIFGKFLNKQSCDDQSKNEVTLN